MIGGMLLARDGDGAKRCRCEARLLKLKIREESRESTRAYRTSKRRRLECAESPLVRATRRRSRGASLPAHRSGRVLFFAGSGVIPTTCLGYSTSSHPSETTALPPHQRPRYVRARTCYPAFQSRSGTRGRRFARCTRSYGLLGDRKGR